WKGLAERCTEDDALRLLRQALSSYEHWWEIEFSRDHDHFRLLGDDNIRRYVPFYVIRVRLESSDTLFELATRAAAARITGARVIISSDEGLQHPLVRLLDDCTDT